MPKTTEIIFVELATDKNPLVAGKPFAGLTHGSFTDMYGRLAKIVPNDLKKMVSNTKELIAATKNDEGELVGLPIDANNHDKGDAAGWLMDVELDDDQEKILFFVSWTEKGVELISKKLRRWFSATVSLANNIIMGGTLTNWPAVRSPKGEYLLSPVELASLYNLPAEELTTLQEIRAVDSAFYAYYGWDDYRVEDIDLEESFAIIYVYEKGNRYKADFSYNDKNEVKFAEEVQWVRVKNTWQEFTSTVMDNIKKIGAPTQNKTTENNLEEFTMNDESRAEITNMISESMAPINLAIADLTEAVTRNGNDSQPEGDPSDGVQVPSQLAELLNFDDMNEELAEQIQGLLMEQFESVERKAKADYARTLARSKIKATTTELANDLVHGTPEIPHGLPVDVDELTEQLLDLPPEKHTYFSDLLKTIWRNGFIEFEELGHQTSTQGLRELPEEIQARLREGKYKIADLSNPILQLGDLSEYDLKEFKEA